MRFERTTWLAALCAPWLLGACFYLEPAPPPQFRYSCDADDECEDNHECINGLCQVACTLDLATLSHDCPQEGEYFSCFNGVCVHSCDVDADECSDPQSCQAFDLEGVDDAGMLGEIGICGQLCDTPGEQDNCPDGHECIDGGICLSVMDGGTTGG
jgi:hypothetical protein